MTLKPEAATLPAPCNRSVQCDTDAPVVTSVTPDGRTDGRTATGRQVDNGGSSYIFPLLRNSHATAAPNAMSENIISRALEFTIKEHSVLPYVIVLAIFLANYFKVNPRDALPRMQSSHVHLELVFVQFN